MFVVEQSRCCKHIELSLRKDIQYTYSTKPLMYKWQRKFNAEETGFPAVKHNRLNPRNRITIAHWVNLQKAGNRDPGKESVYQRENFVPFPAKQAHSQFCSQSYKEPWSQINIRVATRIFTNMLANR